MIVKFFFIIFKNVTEQTLNLIFFALLQVVLANLLLGSFRRIALLLRPIDLECKKKSKGFRIKIIIQILSEILRFVLQVFYKKFGTMLQVGQCSKMIVYLSM